MNMQKILCEMDLSKIDRNRIETKTYTNKEGVEVTKKVYKFEVVESSTKIKVTEGDTWKLMKTHFVAEGQTKEERSEKKKSTILGDGLQFENKEEDTITDPETGEEVPW